MRLNKQEMVLVLEQMNRGYAALKAENRSLNLQLEAAIRRLKCLDEAHAILRGEMVKLESKYEALQENRG